MIFEDGSGPAQVNVSIREMMNPFRLVIYAEGQEDVRTSQNYVVPCPPT